jgi:hypothetical protein
MGEFGVVYEIEEVASNASGLNISLKDNNWHCKEWLMLHNPIELGGE